LLPSTRQGQRNTTEQESQTGLAHFYYPVHSTRTHNSTLFLSTLESLHTLPKTLTSNKKRADSPGKKEDDMDNSAADDE